MILESYFQKHWKPSELACLSIFIDDDGFILNYISIKYIRKELLPIIIRKDIRQNELNFDFIPKNVPILLVLEGKGIIHKKTIRVDGSSVSIADTFPNIKQSEFYIQETISEKYTFFTVARKVLIVDIIDSLNGYGFKVIKLVLGYYDLSNIVELIDKKDFDYFIENKILVFKSGFLNNYDNRTSNTVEQQDEMQVLIGNKISLNHHLLSLYASIFTFYTDSYNNSSYLINSIKDSLIDISSTYFFKKIWRLYIVSIFIAILIAGLFYYAIYTKSLDQNNSIESIKKQNFVNNKELITRSNYNLFFNQHNWIPYPAKSYYLQRIIKIIPLGISLTDVIICPLNELETQKKQYPFYETKQILVSGKCANTVFLNSWIESIKRYPWVIDSKLIQFSFNEIERNGLFKFIIILK